MAEDEKPKAVVRIKTWPGLATNRDEHDAPQAAISGLNMRTHVPGKLTVRKGCKPVTYTNVDTATTDDAISAFGVRQEVGGDMVIYFTSGGNVEVAKGAS